MSDLNNVIVERNIPTTMRDGVVLFSDIYRPSVEGQYPVLLQRTPYNKSLPFIASLTLDPIEAAIQGYVVIIQDTRGRYASEGSFYPFRDDAIDGYDTIEWAANQEWSNGKVGMYGGSYMGVTQWLAATACPPHLITIFPQVTASDYHNGWIYRGGAFFLGFSLYWALVSFAADTMTRQSKDDESISVPDELKTLFDAMDGILDGYKFLPLKDYTYIRNYASYYYDWIAHPSYDDYWRQWNIEEYFKKINLPVYHIGGWYDLFLSGTLNNYSGMVQNIGATRSNSEQRLIVGPWSHGTYMTNMVGDIDFGINAASDAIDLPGLQLRWFNQYLKDINSGIIKEPPVKLFIMGDNVWRDEYEWPLERTQYNKYYFHSNGNANTLNGDGALNFNVPVDETEDTFVYDPLNPVPTYGGANMLPGSLLHRLHGPKDQTKIETRQDVLVYTSQPLEEVLEVTGPITATIYASSTAIDTDFTVKLVDVHLDGYAQILTDGILRGRYRENREEAKLLTPGEIYEYKIDLAATSNVFKPGHRIRVEVSSSNFPRFDRNPNTGCPFGEDNKCIQATQKIFHNHVYPSHIVLPIIPR